MFAPVHRPARPQALLFAKQERTERTERKRKRDEDEDEDVSSSSDDSLQLKLSPPPEASAAKGKSKIYQHAVNKKDPYHIAGLSREDDLPPAPFPHAPIKLVKNLPSTDEELATLNPPLHVPKPAVQDHTSSLKRRHIENLTALLHVCMLRGNWDRASRAWGLLLRTEMGGRGMDVRTEGRWGIGAELLMRRRDVSQDSRDYHESVEGDVSFTDEGFKLARQYYERLILQYPSTPSTRHNVNAQVFYPALFNIWIYSVQHRSKQRRHQITAAPEPENSPTDPEPSNPELDPTEAEAAGIRVSRKQELHEAVSIARRMDELMVSPPYDSSPELLRLRGMIGLWLADLYVFQASSHRTSPEGSRDHDFEDRSERLEAQFSGEQAERERRKGLEMLGKARRAGVEFTGSIKDLFKGKHGDDV
ncbi:hypothetical protein LTR62_004764 [Meristemomyces frigidus]|uniref:Uncharacterized protein n=1 Tax=Meristemomyces frigidus TaxID=1508187 RepID=A0AAN7TG34_9PEZI|nr:hypothetical protein LTR62_004764 [Meristemomyces frigidus]